jgi:alpha-aminoadipic semialdehyde synthase
MIINVNFNLYFWIMYIKIYFIYLLTMNTFDSDIKLPCIGILREVVSVWERRVALTPSGCKKLLDSGIRVVIQPSRIRCFSDDEYLEVGCELNEDLIGCNLIVGLQAPDISTLLAEKTYIIFSHTKKGKTDNQALLEKILEKKIRLIDYECIKEDVEDRAMAKRIVSFGRIAGVAGTINLLKGMGELLLARQVSTPFVFTKLSYMYSDVEDGEHSLKTLGKYLTDQYLPEEFSPFFIAVLGNGRVSLGVQEALSHLPTKFLTPNQLLLGEYENRRDIIYVVVFNPSDIYEKIENESEFDKSEFIKSPELYYSVFESKYLKYFHAIINTLYWESRHPKLLTKSQLKTHVTNHDIKLFAISDISCDIEGSIEILNHYTTFRKPFFIYEPVLEKEIDHVDHSTKEGIIYHAISNLAASFPIDASEHFCNLLLPLIDNLAHSKYPVKFEDQTDLCNELKNACICSNGVLTPLYRNIFRNTEEKKKVEAIMSNPSDKPYFISLKMKGNIFDSGFFNLLINSFNNLDISHKINFLSIGDGADMPSILYFDAFAKTKEDMQNFLKLVKEKIDEHKLESDTIKSNIY